MYMAVLVAYGVYAFGPSATLPLILTVVPIGAALDLGLHRLQKTTQTGYPRSGLISLLIVVTLMPLGVGLITANLIGIMAILSKHFVRAMNLHIFNPAAFGVALGVIFFGISVGWWADTYVGLTILLGLFNVWRIRKFWQIGGFLIIYGLLNLAVNNTLLLLPPHLTATIPWFFTLFMLPEPKTSLRGPKAELAFGGLVGAGAIAFQYLPVVSSAPLLFGLLSANFLRLIPLRARDGQSGFLRGLLQ